MRCLSQGKFPFDKTSCVRVGPAYWDKCTGGIRKWDIVPTRFPSSATHPGSSILFLSGIPFTLETSLLFSHCHAKPNAFPLIRRPSLFERTEVRGAMAEPWDYEEMPANKERRDSQCSPSCINLWHLFVPNWRGWRRHVRAETSTPEKLQASSAAGHCYSEKKTRCGTLIQSIFAETHSVI